MLVKIVLSLFFATFCLARASRFLSATARSAMAEVKASPAAPAPVVQALGLRVQVGV